MSLTSLSSNKPTLKGSRACTVKDRYGSDYEESEDSEDFSSEDSDAEFVTPAVDAAILRTLNKIKRGDPSIYGKTKVFQGSFLAPKETQVRQAQRRQRLCSNRGRTTPRTRSSCEGVDIEVKAGPASGLPTQSSHGDARAR